MIPKKLFWSIILFYFILGLYIFYVSYNSPIVQIELEERDDQWIISKIAYEIIGEKYNIHEGDIVLKINNQDIHDSPKLRIDTTILSASNITLITKEGKIEHIYFNHNDLTSQSLNFFLLPLAYFFIALFLAIFLYALNRGNKLSLSYLILFILSVSLAYGSTALYSRMDKIGTTINSTSMILSAVLFLYFLKYYFQFLGVQLKYFKYIKWLYILPVIVFILTILENFILSLYTKNTVIILSLFFILVVVNFLVTIITYIKYPMSQIKIIFWCILIPFMPLTFLYIIPLLFYQEYILSASLSSILFLLIPLGFIFTQLTERLFDIEYHITRLRYYSFFALFITVCLLIGIYFIVPISLNRIFSLAIFIFMTLVISFYIKEKLDYKNRKVLFSHHGDYIHLLYKSIEDIRKSTNTLELYNKLSTLISNQLEFNVVYILEYNMKEKQLITYQENKFTLHLSIDLALIENLHLGEIKKLESCYIASIHQDAEVKQILILGNSRYTVLKNEELLWLELVILFANNFIDNTKLVEDLLIELNAAQQKENNQPNWLQKLIWMKLETEKNVLAQELHDTILQDQIFLIREMDSIINEHNGALLQTKMVDLRYQLISINHQLRAYCEALKPPLLDTLGLTAALNKLFMQTRKRASFTLISTINDIEIKNEGWPLLIYRVIQEMLNNAIKHSQATYVKILLTQTEYGFEIFYMDNGVGCDMNALNITKSMGLTGLKERVLAFNGSIVVDSYPNEGMQIQIKVGVEK